ncbi:MAG: hypothetical protein DMD90_02985 [Candidatus Rokuibacteriota bacterium]|nr:MAG: hypothetical protein DMD90_02985 [Candidatus Rokubacteria bacterium]
MRSTMRLMIVLGIAFYALTPRGGGALAQTAAPQPAPEMKTDDLLQGDITSDIELTRASIQVRRQALVTAAMDLAPKDADVFWPLYREYREEMAKVNDRFVRLLVGYLENYDSLTDEAARKMLDEYLSIDRARNGVKSTFVPRFGKVIPAKQVARFFQIDNKLDAVINAELAKLVPLAR